MKFSIMKFSIMKLLGRSLAGVLCVASALVFALPDGTVNINRAGAEEIAAALDGVGVRRAEAIVAYRTEFGHFESIDELVAVQGIGQHILDSNRGRIVLSE